MRLYGHSELDTFHRGLALDCNRTDWERGIEDADNPIAPVRIIPVTDELRAQDEAERAARTAYDSGWSIKASLSEDNLRTVRRKASVLRQETLPVILQPEPLKPKREPKPKLRPLRSKPFLVAPKPANLCADCQKPISRRRSRCRACFLAIHRPATPKPACTTCGRVLHGNATRPQCRPCRGNKPDRTCASCGVLLSRKHASERCRQCAPKHSEHKRYSPKPPHRWTPEQDAMLRELYEGKHQHSAYSISGRIRELIGVSKSTALKRARELGLRAIAKPGEGKRRLCAGGCGRQLGLYAKRDRCNRCHGAHRERHCACGKTLPRYTHTVRCRTCANVARAQQHSSTAAQQHSSTARRLDEQHA